MCSSYLGEFDQNHNEWQYIKCETCVHHAVRVLKGRLTAIRHGTQKASHERFLTFQRGGAAWGRYTLYKPLCAASCTRSEFLGRLRGEQRGFQVKPPQGSRDCGVIIREASHEAGLQDETGPLTDSHNQECNDSRITEEVMAQSCI